MAAASGRADDRSDPLSRRRLLQLAGGTGLAAMLAACSAAEPDRGTHRTAGATTKPTTPPPPPPLPQVSMSVLCRDAWGARPARAGGSPHTVTRLTLHHTGVVLGDNRDAPARLRQHQRYHQDQQGWIDIAYHLSVDRGGNIYELRSPDLAGDTATDYDTTGHFLVVCEGDFDNEPLPEAQLHGAALAFAWAAQTFGVATDTLAGHRDVAAATTCPGANLDAHLASGELKARIDAVLAGAIIAPQRLCGPAAAARVADIEAGR